MGATLEQFGSGEEFVKYFSNPDQVIAENVNAIADLTAEFDAFDIIESMREFEAPFTLTGYQESQSEGVVAFVEIVTLILLARGSRTPDISARQEKAPNEIIEQLHHHASLISKVGTFSVLTAGRSNTYGPLTRLASEYRAIGLSVRG